MASVTDSSINRAEPTATYTVAAPLLTKAAAELIPLTSRTFLDLGWVLVDSNESVEKK